MIRHEIERDCIIHECSNDEKIQGDIDQKRDTRQVRAVAGVGTNRQIKERRIEATFAHATLVYIN